MICCSVISRRRTDSDIDCSASVLLKLERFSDCIVLFGLSMAVMVVVMGPASGCCHFGSVRFATLGLAAHSA